MGAPRPCLRPTTAPRIQEDGPDGEGRFGQNSCEPLIQEPVVSKDRNLKHEGTLGESRIYKDQKRGEKQRETTKTSYKSGVQKTQT